MKRSELTKSESKVWQAAATGTLVDFRSGDSELDSPERGAEWGMERTVRAKVIADLLTGDGNAASMPVRGVRVRGARIIGELNLEATMLRCPLALLDCSFAIPINLQEATGLSVRLGGSHVPAVHARQLRTRGDLRFDNGFNVSGGIDLAGAYIGGILSCRGGEFSNPKGSALVAEGLTVNQDMYCDEGFSATGGVRLLGAHIGGQLDCRGGRFSNPNGSGLDLWRATVSSVLFMESVDLEGILDLTAAKVSSYHDNPASWPEQLRLDGFVYDNIEGASAKERLQWLGRNQSGYSPQIYEQLAAVYRGSGNEEDARRILIAKQHRRFKEGTLIFKMWGYLLDWTIGYGYRTERAMLWLVGLLILGTYLFGSVYRGDLTPVNRPDVQPPFQPFFYTLDLLFPVASLHLRDVWIVHGPAQAWSVVFIIMGWVLATAIVLSLTGLLKRG